MSEQNRKLGKLEVLITEGICNVVVPTLLSLKHEMDETLLKEATLEYITTQPNLCSGVKKIDGEWRFKKLAEINDYFEVLSSSYPWKDICLKFGKSRLREENDEYPPLKIFFIPQSSKTAYFITVFAHYAADGTNGMTITHDILNIYSQLCKGEFSRKISYNPTPSVDEMAGSTLLLQNEADLMEKYILDTKEKYKKFNCSIPFEDGDVPASEALYYTSDPDIYEKFIQICRMNKVTVGCALTAAMYFGCAGYIFKNNDDVDINKELVIGCNVPINLRDRVEKNIPKSCCNLSVTQYLLSMSINKETVFWDLVKEMREHFIEIMNDNKLFHLFDFSLLIKNSTEYKDAFDKFGVSQQLCVSNMRSYPASVDYGDFCIESIHCVGGLWIPKWDVLELMIYSTNKFNLSIIHREGIKNALRADNIFKYVKYIVENVSQLSPEFNLEHCMENHDRVESALK